MRENRLISALNTLCISLSLLTNSGVSAETMLTLGDVNGDSMITAVDASAILTEYAVTSVGKDGIFSPAQKEAADVNNDGIVDAVDGSVVLSYYAFCSVNNVIIPLESFVTQGTDDPDWKMASYLSPASIDYFAIPTFTDKPYVVLNNNIPAFDPSDFNGNVFESYDYLDTLGRCGVCVASVGYETMPDEPRGEIGMIKPTGWHLDKYDFIDGKYVYNRCHLLGYQLTGENANPNNLITGTRYLNVHGMLPFEDQIASYVKKTNNHVLYRVTPVFIDNELVCRGVAMEGWSIEDSGTGVCFNVFCYNVQPGVVIDYLTGDNHADESYIITTVTNVKAETTTTTTTTIQQPAQYDYVVNLNSKVFHRPDCPSVKSMSDKNKRYYEGGREELISEGYKPCSKCEP